MATDRAPVPSTESKRPAAARAKRRPPRVPRGVGREALCRALVRVVAREGLDGVTFRSVAREAGVTHGLASYHFRTRETMIREGLVWAARQGLDDARIADDVGELETFATDVPALMRDRPEEAIFQFELAVEAFRRPALLEDVARSYDDYVAAVRRTLERVGVGGDAALARLVFAAIDGLSLQQLIHGDAARTAESLDVLRALLRAGAAAGVSGSAPASAAERPAPGSRRRTRPA